MRVCSSSTGSKDPEDDLSAAQRTFLAALRERARSRPCTPNIRVGEVHNQSFVPTSDDQSRVKILEATGDRGI